MVVRERDGIVAKAHAKRKTTQIGLPRLLVDKVLCVDALTRL